MSLDLTAVLIAFVGNTFLSLFTLFKNPKSATNRLFFLFTLSLIIYLWVNFISTQQSTDDGAFFWVKMVMSVALFINLFFFLLASTFPHLKLETKPLLLWLAVISTFVLLLASQLGLIFKNAKASEVAGDPSIAMPFFLLHTILCLGGGFILLVKKFIRLHGIEKIQLQLFISGTVIMFASIITTNLLFVLVLKTANFVGLLPLYTLTFVGFISYAIVRHRFLDISLIVARTVSFAILVTISSLVYVLVSVTISSQIFGIGLEPRTIVVFTVLTLLVAASFQPLRKILERITDRIFYKERYDANQLLYSMAITMASTLNLEELTTKLIKQLLQQMKLTKGSFILTAKDYIYRVVQEGYISKKEIDQEHINIFLNQGSVLIYDEIQDGNLKDIMRGAGFSIIIPLRTEKEEVGLLALGSKLSGDMYSDDDIRVLRILAPEIAVAIQNTKAYEEIQKFNLRLKEEVDKATRDSIEMTQRIYKMNTQLHQLDKLKDDFVSVASHELRTPMAAIRSYTWMALNRSDIPLSEKLNKYLTRILVSTERLINLVNDMLNISRIESGRIEIKPSIFNIAQLIDDVIGEVDAKAKERNIHLELVKTQTPNIFADPDKVHQVLLNLIGNAMKFTPEEGKVTISFFSDGITVEVSVKDSGVGIAKDDLSRLFQKFGRLDNSYVAMGTSGGTGLGLFICKSLVELMHGKIKASSDGVGKGAIFTFSLPVATEEITKNAAKYEVKAVGEVKGLEPVAI